MNRTDAPKKQAVPFAVNGQREELLPTSPAGDNTASYDAGFPAVTMILKAAGGLPPKGQDMNQILFELSSLARWFSTGSINSYDATFSAEIGGYPKGAIVLGEDGNTRYMSTAEANTSDPNTDGAGWFNLSAGYLKTENNLSEIKGAGPDAVATALSNLGLGDASTTQKGSVQLTESSGSSHSLVLNQLGSTQLNNTNLGQNQTVQDLTATRALGVTYTNTTGKPIAVSVRVTGGASVIATGTVNNIPFAYQNTTASMTGSVGLFFIIPVGGTYSVTSNATLTWWAEMR